LKIKVCYVFRSHKTVVPTRSDLINELGTIKALAQFAQVYCHNKLFILQEGRFVVQKKLPRKYDVYVVRDHPTFSSRVLKRGAPLLMAGVPFRPNLFRRIERTKNSRITVYTEAWKQILNTGRGIPKFNDKGHKFQRVVCIYQTLQEYLSPQQESEITADIRDSFEGNFIVGHFGRFTRKSQPDLFAKAWRILCDKYDGLRFVCSRGDPRQGLNRKRERQIERLQYLKNIEHSQMPYYLSACDITFEPFTHQWWEVTGSLKTKESAACGTPFVTASSAARGLEFGRDYELFIPKKCFRDHHEQTNVDRLVHLISRLVEDDEWRQGISERLAQRAKFFSIEESGKRLKKIVEGVLG